MKSKRNQADYHLEPFLHFQDGIFYNPLTDVSIDRNHVLYTTIMSVYAGNSTIEGAKNWRELVKAQWMIPRDTDVLTRYNLKVVTLEGTAHCNQRCKFCPVSISPKPIHTMSVTFYEQIVKQLHEYKDSIQAVFMINYNEPTLDKYFMDRVRILMDHGLPVCINTNGTGMTKQKVDQLLKLGTLRFLSINLSTLNAEEYQQERSYSKHEQVVRNVDYMKNLPLAQEMAIAVLGENDDAHLRNVESIKQRYGDSLFEVKSFRITNRVGNISRGVSLDQPIEHLAGCDLLGSRPVQHLHINSYGQCFICCQDYYEQYIVGDLNHQSVKEVLISEEMQKIRGMTYGLLDAPDDYICRSCVFALSCSKSKSR